MCAPEKAQKHLNLNGSQSMGENGSAWVEVSKHLVDRVIDIYMVVIWHIFLARAGMQSTFFGTFL